MLTVIREGEDKPLKIRITRAIIKVTSVKDRLLDDEYAYVRISHFQTKSTADLIKSVKKLRKEAGDRKAPGVVPAFPYFLALSSFEIDMVCQDDSPAQIIITLFTQ